MISAVRGGRNRRESIPGGGGRDRRGTAGVGECGCPRSISSVKRRRTARRCSGRCWLAPGWPESTGRCGGGERWSRASVPIRVRGSREQGVQGSKWEEGGRQGRRRLHLTTQGGPGDGQRRAARHGASAALHCGDRRRRRWKISRNPPVIYLFFCLFKTSRVLGI